MNILIGITALFLIIIFSLIETYLYPLYMYHIRGKSRYKSEKLSSMGGIYTSYNWYKSDEEALEKLSHRDFIDKIYPRKHKKRIKPVR